MARGLTRTSERTDGVGAVRRRLLAAASVVLLVVLGLAVHFATPDSAASDIAGDALYAAMVYALLVLLLPRWSPWAVALGAATWGVAVELFQLTGLPERWGAAFAPVMLVLGTVFDPRDIVIAIVTAGACAAVDATLRAVAARR